MSLPEFENIESELGNLIKPLKELEESLNLGEVRKEIDGLEKETSDADFWSNSEQAGKVIDKLNTLKQKVNAFDDLISKKEEIEVLVELGKEDDEQELADEASQMLNQLKKDQEALWITTLLSGEHDKENAVLTLHAGAGGTESCDWASMLYRMYTRWADSKGYKTEVLDFIDGDVTGYKSITFEVSGNNAYGYLKGEQGIHRLVRISPFNAVGKRQTSFVSLDVMPDINTQIDIDIPEDDIRIDTYRSSGAGGQHINKTSSAIRITHIPTGTVVQCQNERSQHQNKEKAMNLLKSKLLLLKEAEQAEDLSEIRGEVRDINFGSQIRSYVLQPYTMVKDHRTNIEVGNATKVLDGELDPFITGYLINKSK